MSNTSLQYTALGYVSRKKKRRNDKRKNISELDHVLSFTDSVK